MFNARQHVDLISPRQRTTGSTPEGATGRKVCHIVGHFQNPKAVRGEPNPVHGEQGRPQSIFVLNERAYQGQEFGTASSTA